MSIPVIDVSRFHVAGRKARQRLAAALANACRDTGFFCITGHRVVRCIIVAMREMTVELFRLPMEEKRALCAAPGVYRGYIPLAAFGNNASSEGTDGYEGFKLHREVAVDDPIRETCDLYGPNRWPTQIPGFRRAVLDYWDAMDALSEELLRLFALALGLEESRLLPCFEEPLTNMTLLHYPRSDGRGAGAGIHPHRDIDAFTILCPGNVPGLEVMTRDRRWIEGFDRAAVETGFLVRDLYRTNWKSVAQTNPGVDAGTVGSRATEASG